MLHSRTGLTRLHLILLACLIGIGAVTGQRKYADIRRQQERLALIQEAQRQQFIQEEGRKKKSDEEVIRQERSRLKEEAANLLSQMISEVEKLPHITKKQKLIFLNFREKLQTASGLLSEERFQDAGTLLQQIASELEKNRPRVLRHTVQPGETLWTISQKYYGTGFGWTKIGKANPSIPPSHELEKGQVLVIP